MENTEKNEVGYYYYEVQNKTDKTHTVQIIIYGWEATCIPGIKTTKTFLDSNATKVRASSVEVADFLNYSDCVPKNPNGDFRYVVENQTDQDTYVMNMFVNKDDKIVYNTSWVKLPAGKNVGLN